MNKKTLILIILGVSILPSSALADSPLQKILQNVIDKAVWPIGAAAVVVFWIITGLLFLWAQGAPEKLKQARTALLTAIFGTILIVLAFSAYYIIKDAIGV